jgi:hypothetical protein
MYYAKRTNRLGKPLPSGMRILKRYISSAQLKLNRIIRARNVPLYTGAQGLTGPGTGGPVQTVSGSTSEKKWNTVPPPIPTGAGPSSCFSVAKPMQKPVKVRVEVMYKYFQACVSTLSTCESLIWRTRIIHRNRPDPVLSNLNPRHQLGCLYAGQPNTHLRQRNLS